MIKFFRNIRQGLLMQNNTSKYLKYAIGEIALVIIGILLALQINNWNEGRKQDKNIEDLLTVFESELEANIESCTSLIRYGYLRDSVATLYVSGQLTPDILRNNGRVRWMLGFGTSTRRFIDDNLDELIATEKQLPRVYSELVPDLKELKRRIESQRKWEQVAIDISISSKKEMTLNYPWYQLHDSLSREQQIEHYLNDPIYKGRLLHYNDYQLGENVWDASLIRSSSIALLWKIKEIRGNTPPTIEEFLIGFDLEPFETLSCDIYPYEVADKVYLHTSFIMYNNKEDTIYFNLTDTQGRIRNSETWSLAPHSFLLYELSANVNRCIQVLENDSCQTVFHGTKEDYVIIN